MSWLLTYTGKRFTPGKPQFWDFSIRDIAHALSNMPRFAGHTKKLYSVAQHSVIVSQIMRDGGLCVEAQLEGLLHDATEAYLMDLPMPIKQLEELKPYKVIEATIDEAIMASFGIRFRRPLQVKHADIVALATEARDFMGNPTDWPSIKDVLPLPEKLFPMTPDEAKIAFLERYLELREQEAAGT